MTDMDTSPTKAAAEERAARANALTASLGALTALLALATGVLGFTTHNQTEKKQEAQSQAQDLSGAVDALRKENADLKAENDALKQQLTDVRSSPDPSGTAATTPP